MLREILARFGIRVNVAPLKKAAARIRAMVTSLKGMAGIMAAGFLVRGLKSFISNMIDLGDEIAKTSRALGLSGDELLAWRFAAERSGVNAAQLGTGFKRLQRNIVDANQGLSTAVRAFRAVGVETRDAEGNTRELLDIIPDLADGFVRLTTDSERSARAQELFGRAGADLLPFFEDGSKGIQKLLARFQELTGGQGFGQFLKMSEEAQDALSDFNLTVFALKTTIAIDILPIVTEFALKTARLFAQIRKATQDTDVWKAALIALGSVAAAVGIAMFVAFIKPIALIAALTLGIFLLVLAVQDFVSFMEGKDSVIGRILKGWGIDVGIVRRRFKLVAKDQRFFWGEVFPALMKRAKTNLGRFADDMEFAWGMVFDAIGDGFTALGDDIGRITDTIVANWNKAVESITNGIDEISDAIRGAATFLGINVGGTAGGPSVRGAAGGGSAAGGPVIRGAAGGANVQTNQNVQIDIDARGSSDPQAIGAAVRDAVRDATNTNLRTAQRALIQVG